ncbi:O-antigen ligase domain-containing protein [Wenzhouxiangella sediminis]|uniref:O-antigen ligase domain-containing protein n=2 Tax=Wenzhouxiangella sediminis TaxID=1792836 RepID=A0A3E1KCE9_9GAMM|nr:O-antigen ligase domain-containing protein [Wenzhouxiangella sediminis]
MMGHRTPETLTASLLMMVLLACGAAGFAIWSGEIKPPSRNWLTFAGIMTALVVLYVLPLPLLARLFGPYPETLQDYPGLALNTWSPDPGATLRGWAAFTALFVFAWLGRALPGPLRHWVFLSIVGMALFQAVYGLLSHAGGVDTIFGIWPRNNPDWVHGSYSNRNLFGAYLALTWPLAVGLWFVRGVPGIHRLPLELRVTGSVLCGAIIGAAMLGSGSRLGSAAGVFGILLALMLWGRHRRLIHGASAWPAYIAAAGALVAATWYGLTPLAERLLATTGEESRLEVFRIMLTEFPVAWWIHGVGLGGFEAVFKQFQPGDIRGWYDYAHNDLLQWGIETGLPGLLLLGAVAWKMLRRFRMNTERIALYAGLAALCLVALGDFSWHIPGTQVVLAFYIGALLR